VAGANLIDPQEPYKGSFLVLEAEAKVRVLKHKKDLYPRAVFEDGGVLSEGSQDASGSRKQPEATNLQGNGNLIYVHRERT
jgi:hypothetical protein